MILPCFPLVLSLSRVRGRKERKVKEGGKVLGGRRRYTCQDEDLFMWWWSSLTLVLVKEGRKEGRRKGI